MLAGLVKAAGGAEACLVDGVGDALGGSSGRPDDWLGLRCCGRFGRAQGILEVCDSLGAGELAGADAEHATESAQKGEAADAGGTGQVGQAGAFGGMFGEVLAGGGYDGGLGVRPWRGELRLTALAGAEASLLRGGGGGEEVNTLARGAAARTAWTAIYPGGFDGIEELAVGAGIARSTCCHWRPGKRLGAASSDEFVGREGGFPWLGWFCAAGLLCCGWDMVCALLPVSSLAPHRATLRKVQRSYGRPGLASLRAGQRSRLLAGRVAPGTKQKDHSVGKQFFVGIPAQLLPYPRGHELTA